MRTYGHNAWLIYTAVLNEINILYFTRFSVRPSISKRKLYAFFLIRGQKAYIDGQTDIIVDIFSCIKKNLTKFSVWSSTSELEAVMLNDYRHTPLLTDLLTYLLT